MICPLGDSEESNLVRLLRSRMTPCMQARMQQQECHKAVMSAHFCSTMSRAAGSAGKKTFLLHKGRVAFVSTSLVRTVLCTDKYAAS
jgi:hypothetical protein